MEREFTLSSRRPGIGRNYYESHKTDIYLTDEIFFNGKKFKPPRYFDKLYELDNSMQMADVKNNRLLAIGLEKAALHIVDDEKYRQAKALLLKKKCRNLLKRTDFNLDNSFISCYNKLIERSSSGAS